MYHEKALFFNTAVRPTEILNWSLSSVTLYLKSKVRSIKVLSWVFKIQEANIIAVLIQNYELLGSSVFGKEMLNLLIHVVSLFPV